MMRRPAAFIAVIALLLVGSAASADEPALSPPVITPVQKGALAPFTGILLTPEAVAKVIADAKDCPKRVEVEAARARDEAKALGEKQLADAKSDAKHDHDVLQAGIERRDGDIKDLNERLKESERSRPNVLWYAGGGVLGGAIVAILTMLVGGLVK